MAINLNKDKFIYYTILALFALFFTIPVFGLCMLDSKFNSSKRFVSFLLLLLM